MSGLMSAAINIGEPLQARQVFSGKDFDHAYCKIFLHFTRVSRCARIFSISRTIDAKTGRYNCNF
jgi:hypothetical protein